MNEIEKIFEGRYIKSGQITLYPKNVALEVIRECRKLSVNILGIDGFIISEKHTQSNLEDIIDFSSISFFGNACDLSEQFINERPTDMYFEIVIR